MLKNILLPSALLALSQGAFAVELPNAGSQMQQIPPAPAPLQAPPKVDVDQFGAPATPATSAILATDTVKIVVNSLTVMGARTYSEALLIAVSGFKAGSELSLADLRGMAARIADYYRRHGYFIAQAYLPAQDIKDGVVSIAVIEGHYGKVTLNNRTNLADNLANGLLDGLNNGDLVAAAPLENRLLLLSDLPGIKVKSTLLPGAALGASDLIVELTPGPRVAGSIDADNGGSRYTGEYRLGATLNFNEPFGQGDVASLRVLTSGAGLNYARAAYQRQFGKAKAGVAYSNLRYSLGREFESLQANGTAQIVSLYGSYPLIRSRNENLYVGLNLDDKTFRDKVDSTSTVSNKAAQVVVASLYGDQRDALGGGGANSFMLAWTSGSIDIQTPGVRTLDAATAQSNGHFDKLGFSVSRLQRVTESISLYASMSGQLASKNLDSSEKMELGGMYGVRAYPQGEAYADQGYVLNLEARMQLPKYSEKMLGQLQLIGFVDTGAVVINKNAWTTAPNHRTLSGAGVGLSWAEPNNFTLRAYYAFKLGNEAATSAPDKSGRFWVQLVKYF